MKLMAIDYGEKRVGIASTDDSGNFALPRAVWPNSSELLNKVLKFKEKEGIEKIILGESINFKGEPNLIQKKIEEFKKLLESHGAIVVYHTEVMTTVEARHLQGNTELTDASAAAIILRNYIDAV